MVVGGGHDAAFDRPLLDLFVRDRQPLAARGLWRALETAVGQYRGLLWEVLLVAVLLLARRWKAALASAALLGVTLATTLALKPWFDRPPLIDNRQGYFPSTHAAGAFAFCVSCAAVCWHTRARLPVAAAAGLVVLAYGANLVYTRSHYPSDVVGGWGVAAGWAGLALMLL